MLSWASQPEATHPLFHSHALDWPARVCCCQPKLAVVLRAAEAVSPVSTLQRGWNLATSPVSPPRWSDLRCSPLRHRSSLPAPDAPATSLLARRGKCLAGTSSPSQCLGVQALRPDLVRCVYANRSTAPQAARELGDARSPCRNRLPAHPWRHPPAAPRDPHLSVWACLAPKWRWCVSPLGVSPAHADASLNLSTRSPCHHWPRLAPSAVCSPPKWLLAGTVASGVFPNDALRCGAPHGGFHARPEGRFCVV